jgi:hypothetical protein
VDRHPSSRNRIGQFAAAEFHGAAGQEDLAADGAGDDEML